MPALLIPLIIGASGLGLGVYLGLSQRKNLMIAFFLLGLFLLYYFKIIKFA